ncbi:hypothetical protein FNW02_00500 [Komarekiella sp. 'clone 1']|uniref:Uncharacterized protein n=1 Tax=Komarekiella delphini-convector SJRDD-AB1 TaxID=2593771 RepID=A0AA40SSH6_9NOST|nr:hypothetical protein [Komarekiella delphini-convector]MBD6614391.1 hypothetical protein [Komarekiella delphini-convector SJRDD-AB1]
MQQANIAGNKSISQSNNHARPHSCLVKHLYCSLTGRNDSDCPRGTAKPITCLARLKFIFNQQKGILLSQKLIFNHQKGVLLSQNGVFRKQNGI